MKMKRFFDLSISIIALMIFFIPMLLIAILIRLTSHGPAIYWSKRIGINSAIFKMPKFRTMIIDTPTIATHLIENYDDYLTPVGGILRRFSLDEIPQLFSILKGDMSLVGPRPALYNQDDLIALRKDKGVDKLTPGVTGWAQINGRDSISIPEKVNLDLEYLNRKSFFFDLFIIKSTIFKVIMKNDISH
jgi:O-antigen biosynthesis protein WbqP